MKLSLERKLAYGSVASIVILLLITTVAWWNAARFRGTHYWINNTYEVLNQLEHALTDVLSMQAGARGYVITGDSSMLEPYRLGAARLGQSLDRLELLVKETPRQRDSLAQLRPLPARLRALMDEHIRIRDTQGSVAGGDPARYLEGQKTVEEFRALIRTMTAEERRLLDDRLERANGVGRLTVFAIVGTSLVAIVLVTLAALVVRRDLRRRRDAEAALQESFARVEDLYNKAPCGYHSLDGDGRFIAINDTALAWLGYARDEVVGRMHFTDVLTANSAAIFAERFEHFRKNGQVHNVEYEWRRKDGTVLPVLLNAVANYDAQGRYLSSRATVFDVTQRKRAEEERDRFFTLSRDLLCIAGVDGYFQRLNPEWQRVLGFSVEELCARPAYEFIHPEDREPTEKQAARLAAGEHTVAFENRYRCRDGTYRWLRWSATMVPGESLVYASARDVTDSKVADDRIQNLNADLGSRAAQLEAANRELESFSYSVSHDLRAPLRHIDGFTGLLMKRSAESLDAESQRYLHIISKAAKQMGLLIDDLLAFSRIGRAPFRFEAVRHDALVAGVIAEGRYDNGGNRIQWDVSHLPDVQADPAMLRQVWVNLVENAVKYSSKTAQPRITIGGAEAASGELEFFVRDNGVGFDMSYADKLFGVFQRLHGPSEFEGTGIGLANVRRIITRHGGRTWAEGRVGAGAVFYFSLPANLSSVRSSI